MTASLLILAVVIIVASFFYLQIDNKLEQMAKTVDNCQKQCLETTRFVFRFKDQVDDLTKKAQEPQITMKAQQFEEPSMIVYSTVKTQDKPKKVVADVAPPARGRNATRQKKTF